MPKICPWRSALCLCNFEKIDCVHVSDVSYNENMFIVEKNIGAKTLEREVAW